MFALMTKKRFVPLSYFAGGNEGEEDEEEEEENVTEVRFVPDAVSSLEAMFKAMNECQLLHPDPFDSPDDEEDDEGDDDDEEDEEQDIGVSVEYDVDHAERMHGVDTIGNGRSSRNEEEEAMDIVPGQFDDAD